MMRPSRLDTKPSSLSFGLPSVIDLNGRCGPTGLTRDSENQRVRREIYDSIEVVKPISDSDSISTVPQYGGPPVAWRRIEPGGQQRAGKNFAGRRRQTPNEAPREPGSSIGGEDPRLVFPPSVGEKRRSSTGVNPMDHLDL